MYKKISVEIAKFLFKLCLAALFIGVFKSYDLIIAILLTAVLIYDFKVNIFKKNKAQWLLFIGVIITGVIGLSAEFWGVSNGYWAYHDIEGDFPLWLPMAWMLSFRALYHFEKRLFLAVPNLTMQTKWGVTFLVAFTIPALGEMITIALGVWTYNWPYQILGIPVIVFFLLTILHLFVFQLLRQLSQKYEWDDIVFGK
jgi:hypothetical protein